MSGLKSPILNLDNFLRLIQAGAWAAITKRQGLPPSLPLSKDIAAYPMGELSLGDSLADFHRAMISFLGLKGLWPPDLQKTAGNYAERLQNQWLKGSRQIVFHTSGSTGEPQASPHSEPMLIQENVETLKLFNRVKRVVTAVPLLHSYGFIFGLMLPKALDLPVIDVPPLPTFLAEMLRPGDLVVGFPHLFSRLTTIAPPDVQLLSATAPCPDKLIEAMLNNGFSKFTEIYGASETGAIAARFSPGPFQLLSYWRKIDDRSLNRRLPDGRDQSYTLPDHLLWDGQRRLVPQGRIDQAVQVAGVNVYPGRVAAVIKEHPRVQECMVRLMGPAEGFRLKAFIVPCPGLTETDLKQELNRFLRRRLSAPERPGHLAFGRQLPFSISGKAMDWAIK